MKHIGQGQPVQNCEPHGEHEFHVAPEQQWLSEDFAQKTGPTQVTEAPSGTA